MYRKEGRKEGERERRKEGGKQGRKEGGNEGMKEGEKGVSSFREANSQMTSVFKNFLADCFTAFIKPAEEKRLCNS